MDFFALYKEQYYFELTRKNQLTSQLSIPIGILTILGGLASYFYRNISICSDYKHNVIIILFILSIISFVYTIYYLIRSYYGFSYSYIPSPKVIDAYKNDLSTYHKSVGNPEDVVERELKEYLIGLYASTTHINIRNNDSKSEYLHKANTFLIATLVLLIISALIIGYIDFNQCTNLMSY
jgi:hypothetical protein